MRRFYEKAEETSAPPDYQQLQGLVQTVLTVPISEFEYFNNELQTIIS